MESAGVKDIKSSKALNWEFMEQKVKFKRSGPSNAQHMFIITSSCCSIFTFSMYAYLIKTATEKKRWNRQVCHLVICIIFWNWNALYHFLPFPSRAISVFVLLSERMVVSIRPLIFSSRDRLSDTGHSNFSFRRAHLKWPQTTVRVFMHRVYFTFLEET